MTEMSETVKVEAPPMYLLHEWSFGVDQSVGFQNSMHFCDASVRVNDMFKDRLSYHGVEKAVGEGQVMPISNDTCPWTPRDVGLYDFYAGPAKQFVAANS